VNGRKKVLVVCAIVIVLLIICVGFVSSKAPNNFGSVDKISNKVVYDKDGLLFETTYAIPKYGVAKVKVVKQKSSSDYVVIALSNYSNLIPVFSSSNTHSYELLEGDRLFYYVFYDKIIRNVSVKNKKGGSSVEEVMTKNYFLVNDTTTNFDFGFYSKDILFGGEVEVDLLFKNNTDFTQFADVVILDPIGNISGNCSSNATAIRCNGSIRGQFINAGAKDIWINGAVINSTVSGASGCFWATTNGSIEILNSTINAFGTALDTVGNFSVVADKTVIINSSTINSRGAYAHFNVTASDLFIDNSTINNYGGASRDCGGACGDHGGIGLFQTNLSGNLSMHDVVLNNYGGTGASSADNTAGSGGATNIVIRANFTGLVNSTIINYGGTGGYGSAGTGDGGAGGSTKFRFDGWQLSLFNTHYDGGGGNGGDGSDDRGGSGGNVDFHVVSQNFIVNAGSKITYELDGGDGGAAS